MKKLFLFITFEFCLLTLLQAQNNVGIGTTSPAARLDVFLDSGALSLNVYNAGNDANPTGLKASVAGNNLIATKKAGEFLVTGHGASNNAVTAGAGGGEVNYAGLFTAANGTALNIGIKGISNGLNGAFNSGVYGECSSNNGYAGYFKGTSYFSNRMIAGTNTSPENAQLTVRTPDTSYNVIFASTANPGGNGVLSTYMGSPSTYYAFWGIAPANNNNVAGYFSGNVTVTGTFSNPSDERLKQNIEPLAGALNKVMKLRVHTYNFRPEYSYMNLASGRQFGYLAQNLEKVFPELVQNSVDKMKGQESPLHYKTVNYIGMIPVLTKALQEEHEELLKTQNEVKELTTRLQALEQVLLRVSATVAGSKAPLCGTPPLFR